MNIVARLRRLLAGAPAPRYQSTADVIEDIRRDLVAAAWSLQH